MKEKIFVAWSGTTAIAEEVEKHLNKSGYMAIIGGDRTVKPDSMFVGQSIINQMRKCSQAIFIITKKDIKETKQSIISNNLFFELGYMVSRLRNSKIHLFYIDIDENDPLIPSDLKGVWANYLTSNTDGNNTLADKIVSCFLKTQYEIIPEEKMDIVLRWYDYKRLIQNYLDVPMHSNFEMAQYILFYIQAVFFFDDYHESLYLLEKLKDNSGKFSYELRCAIDCAILILRFYQNIGTHKLDSTYFDQVMNDLENSLNKSQSMDASEFKQWYEALHYENMGFAHYLLLLNDDICAEQKEELILDMLDICSSALNCCDVLSNAQNTEKSLDSAGTTLSTNYYFATLYKAYIYRQIAIAYQMAKQCNVNIPTEYSELCCNATNNSFEMRRVLFEKYDIPHMNQLIKNNFEMEYYIAMAETIQHGKVDEGRDVRRKCRMLKAYIDKVEQQNLLNKDIIQKIRQAIKESERCI